MLIYQGKKMWWAWAGGGHEYRDRVPAKKIGPFLARPEPQYRGQKTVSTQDGNGLHTFTLFVANGHPIFVLHELSWQPAKRHRMHIKRAHIAYEVFGDPMPPASLEETFEWTGERWEPCIHPLLSDAVPQPRARA